MKPITLDDYLFYAPENRAFEHLLTDQLRKNAVETVRRVNLMLTFAEEAGVTLDTKGDRIVTSGWRPPARNAAIPTAAVNSKHMTCQACDLFDPDGDLDEWLISPHHSTMSSLGLWLEHPAATKGWCHVQTVPPNSGRRVFYP